MDRIMASNQERESGENMHEEANMSEAEPHSFSDLERLLEEFDAISEVSSVDMVRPLRETSTPLQTRVTMS